VPTLCRPYANHSDPFVIPCSPARKSKLSLLWLLFLGLGDWTSTRPRPLSPGRAGECKKHDLDASCDAKSSCSLKYFGLARFAGLCSTQPHCVKVFPVLRQMPEGSLSQHMGVRGPGPKLQKFNFLLYLQHMGPFWPGALGPELRFSIVIYSQWELSDLGPKAQKFNFPSQFTAYASFPTRAPRPRNLIFCCNSQHMGIFWPGTQTPEIEFSIAIYSI